MTVECDDTCTVDCGRCKGQTTQPDRLCAPGDLVWVATLRRGVQAHKPAGDGATLCRRSMRTGTQITASVAQHTYGAGGCGRCWPWATYAELTNLTGGEP